MTVVRGVGTGWWVHSLHSLQEVPYMVGCVLTASNLCAQNYGEPVVYTQVGSSLHQSQSIEHALVAELGTEDATSTVS